MSASPQGLPCINYALHRKIAISIMKKQKLSEKHHIRRLHGHRLRWFAVLAVGLIITQTSTHPPQAQAAKVLAYSTNVSISGLVEATNQSRAANGLGALAVNAALNSGAQSKADHMIAHNYWAHTAPDGTEPWHFFSQTGYNYTHAGENLAYGFDSSSEIQDAWMNSPGHRANVLGDYKDVGFGIANGSSYQSGENTVVVAFYGTQATPTPAPAPTPKVSTKPTPTPTAEPTPALAAEPMPTPTPEPEAPAPAAEPEPEPVSTEPAAEPVAPQNVSTLQNLLAGNGSWGMYGGLGLVGVSAAGFVTTHRKLVRRGWKYSAHFILVHPALDTALLIALIAALLSSTVGFIR